MINFNLNENFCPSTVSVLGSTGSVGKQTLEVVDELGLRVDLLTAGSNINELFLQINKYSPKCVCVKDEKAYKDLKALFTDDPESKTDILFREDEVFDAIRNTSSDLIFHSVSGMAGIKQAVAASLSGKRVGMANKESIITLGDKILEDINKTGGELVPVDSEHNAIFRCMIGNSHDDIKKIVLTASGGPFFSRNKDEFSGITVEETLNHPTWKMGKKITIDSATLMNKGFELIEAVRLFGKNADEIDIVVHKQSIVHSLVQFRDNTMLGLFGKPDMRDCIRYAATAPHTANVPGADDFKLTDLFSLTFEEPDYEKFPLLKTAKYAVSEGGTMPASLIASDEVAVEAFLNRQIKFTDISYVVNKTLSKVHNVGNVSLESVLDADAEARKISCDIVNGMI